MDIFISRISILFITASLLLFSCSDNSVSDIAKTPQNGDPTPAIIAESFAYPVGKKEYVTQARDKNDDWYNAQDFGENDHLGEDWNKNSGGNTDCGEPVYAIADGLISYAEHAGSGWGNVIIITHKLPDGRKIQSLYGHLQEIKIKSGTVKERQLIGTIGNADGRYLCHLHFEIREYGSYLWNAIGPGYAENKQGFIDPSNFIDSHRRKREQ